jgi:hypothetical protein
MNKFDFCRPVTYELSFRADGARGLAVAIQEKGYVDSVDACDLSQDGHGQVVVRVRATDERQARRRLERHLETMGEWVDRSEGQYGPDALLIFVPV